MRENREIWPSKSPQSKKSMEAVAENKRKEIFELPRDPELQKVIDTFDLQLLRDNLKLVAAKSGVDPDTLHIVPLNHVVGLVDSSEYANPGSHSAAGNFIVLNRKSLDGNNLSENISFLAGAIRLILHEEIHAASFTMVDGRDNVTTGSREVQVDSGYSRTVTDSDAGYKKTFFKLFEEGVTDQFAIEQTLLYGKTHPEVLTPQDRKIFSDIMPAHGGYHEAILLVKHLIFYIARETGTPQETVWNAIVAGKFNGDGLFAPGVKEWFDKNISPDFLKRLESEETEDGILVLMEEVIGKHKQYIIEKALRTTA